MGFTPDARVNAFSRNRITSSIILPARAIIAMHAPQTSPPVTPKPTRYGLPSNPRAPPPIIVPPSGNSRSLRAENAPDSPLPRSPTPAQIISHHEANGTVPRPFAPFAFALHHQQRSSQSPIHSRSPSRGSILSSIFRAHAPSPSSPLSADGFGLSVPPTPHSPKAGSTFSAGRASFLSFESGSSSDDHSHTSRSQLKKQHSFSSLFSFYSPTAKTPASASTMATSAGLVPPTPSYFPHPPSPASQAFSFPKTPKLPYISSKLFSLSRPTSPSHRLSQSQKQVTVYQSFSPLLPDELLVSPGQKMTLITSYDDGWSIVSRPSVFSSNGSPKITTAAQGHFRSESDSLSPLPSPSPLKSKFSFDSVAEPDHERGDAHADIQLNIELGAVPTWCLSPSPFGLAIAMERPMRSTSLGIVVEVPVPSANGPTWGRGEVISWSNFS
ncbi:hypothetical protein SISSUDRAFT_361234 [Sistotremastrum suecicum HHB10207 ss-3]|uniref:SH3 domain-containing protein n=1 Tax=Sistotremastrum suecicum HHB10207 ss-3 TaxID=1314776 RepID=A0A165Z5U0_9AGAM|nr:hypothetical protein SISSUDRAFT_361234 [Sistotremastrum suecicum HHB10207 ss-3]